MAVEPRWLTLDEAFEIQKHQLASFDGLNSLSPVPAVDSRSNAGEIDQLHLIDR